MGFVRVFCAIWLFFKLQRPFLRGCLLGPFKGFLITLYFSLLCPVFSHAGIGERRKKDKEKQVVFVCLKELLVSI